MERTEDVEKHPTTTVNKKPNGKFQFLFFLIASGCFLFLSGSDTAGALRESHIAGEMNMQNDPSLDTWAEIHRGSPIEGAVCWSVTGNSITSHRTTPSDQEEKTPFFSYFIRKIVLPSECTVRFTIRPTSTKKPYGFALRFTDIDNHYLIVVTNEGDLQFHRLLNGKDDLLATVQGHIPADFDSHIELKASGATYELFLDGESLLKVCDGALTGGSFGFVAGESSQYVADHLLFSNRNLPPEQVLPSALVQAYPLWVVGGEAILMWETNKPLPSTVRFGTSPDILTQTLESSEPARVHKVSIPNLKKGTQYYYETFSGTLSCGKGSFRTDPGPDAPFTFGIIGDTQKGSPQATQLCQLMAARSPSLILHAGDIVNDGSIVSQWHLRFFCPFNSIHRIAPTYATLGAHDIIRYSISTTKAFEWDNEESLASWDYRCVNTYLPYPGTKERKRYYAFTYGNVRFIFLTDEFRQLYQEGSPQMAWLLKEFESEAYNKATWHIIIAHAAPYSCGWKTWEEEGKAKMREFIEPLMSKFHVDLLVSGHTHSYERGYINGILHIISGGGGSYGEDYGRNHFHVQKFTLEAHYCMTEVTAGKLTLTAYDLNDQKIDRVVLEKGHPWELSEKPVVVKPAVDGLTGEQEIVVTCPGLKGTRLHWRAVLAERRTKDPFWEPTPETYDGGEQTHLRVKFPETGTFTVKIQALDADLRPTAWVDAGKVEIK